MKQLLNLFARVFPATLVPVLVAWALVVPTGAARGEEPVSFTKDVAPVLVKKCQACHGSNEPKSDYQLHTFALLQTAGATTSLPITAGKPEESELVRLISSTDSAERMPKDDEPLPPEIVALITRWVAEGAIFDGPDPSAALSSYIPKGPHPASPQAYRLPIPVTAMAFRPDGQELVVGGYYELTVWNPADGSLLRRLGNIDQRTFGLAYSPDGSLLAVAAGSSGVSGEVKLIDPNSGAVVRELGAMSDWALDVAFNPAGTRLAACSADRTIRVFDVATGKQELLIEDHADWVMSIAWNHDGTRLASASRDKTSKLFDAANGDSLATYPGHGEPVYGVSFSADGAQVLTGGGNKMVHVWNPADGNKIAEIGGFGGDVFKVLVRQGHIFTCAGDNTAKQFQAADRAEVRSFAGHSDWVYSVAFHEGTGRLATGSFDGEVRVWNVADGTAISTFKAAPGLVPPVAAQAAAQ